MKEKELIEAAMAFVAALTHVIQRGYIPRAEEKLLIQAAEAYRQAQEQPERLNIFMDGNKWCALKGENLQTGHAGFGDTPNEAFENYAKQISPEDFSFIDNPSRRIAPWKDSEDNELFVGDELFAADGTKGTIQYCKVCETEAVNWIVVFKSGRTWPLRIFINRDKAIKVSP